MLTTMPIILSQAINELDFFWLGGGHVDLKIRVATSEFKIKFFHGHIFLANHSRTFSVVMQ